MDIISACNILEIDDIKSITIDQLKKKYHRLALLNHPDKNGNTQESTKKFQLIQEAYELLKQEIFYVETKEPKEEKSAYMFLLQMFINGLIQGKYNEIITSIVKNVVLGCKELSLKILDDLDSDACLFIYDFLTKHKLVLRLDDDIIEKVKQVIKMKGMQLFILNPSLKDLHENNIYKLLVNDKVYLVPLWHDELYFDEGIIVKCIPELPENIEIDEYNNIHVLFRVSFTFSLLEKEFLELYVDTKRIVIFLKDLQMVKCQTYTLRNQGISIINEKNMYDIETKSDIIVKIIFY